MPPSMDVFEGSAFDMRSLTAALNEEPYVPGQVGSLGIFAESGITTTRVMIERRGGTVALVPTTPRGGPGTQNVQDKRDMVSLEVPHLQLDDAVNADEIQGIRAFGSENQLQTIQALVNEKNAAMARKHDMTMEFHRLGAIRGIVYDADGSSVLFDLATLFGESLPGTVDFDLDAASPASGVLRTVCSGVIRTIAGALGGLRFTSIHGLCGSLFMDQLMAHANFTETHVYREGAVLRLGVPYTQQNFGGITFEEYRGDSAGDVAIADGEVQIFPVGVPDLFITRYAPADYEETVNTVGLPRYGDQRPDPSAPKKRRILEVQTNPMHICTRPRVLVNGTNT